MSQNRPTAVYGVIQNTSCTKSQNSLSWTVSVSVDIVPGAGESVALVEGGGGPSASVRNSSNTEIGTISLTKGAGNTWTGSGEVFQEPHSVVFRCRFISDIVEASCGC